MAQRPEIMTNAAPGIELIQHEMLSTAHAENNARTADEQARKAERVAAEAAAMAETARAAAEAARAGANLEAGKSEANEAERRDFLVAAQPLNDAAEMRIYGAGPNREFKGDIIGYRYERGEDGSKHRVERREMLRPTDDRRNPEIGIIESLRRNRNGGQPEAGAKQAAEKAAKAYESGVNELLGMGLELYQAERIQNSRLERGQRLEAQRNQFANHYNNTREVVPAGNYAPKLESRDRELRKGPSFSEWDRDLQNHAAAEDAAMVREALLENPFTRGRAAELAQAEADRQAADRQQQVDRANRHNAERKIGGTRKPNADRRQDHANKPDDAPNPEQPDEPENPPVKKEVAPSKEAKLGSADEQPFNWAEFGNPEERVVFITTDSKFGHNYLIRGRSVYSVEGKPGRQRNRDEELRVRHLWDLPETFTSEKKNSKGEVISTEEVPVDGNFMPVLQLGRPWFYSQEHRNTSDLQKQPKVVRIDAYDGVDNGQTRVKFFGDEKAESYIGQANELVDAGAVDEDVYLDSSTRKGADAVLNIVLSDWAQEQEREVAADEEARGVEWTQKAERDAEVRARNQAKKGGWGVETAQPTVEGSADGAFTRAYRRPRNAAEGAQHDANLNAYDRRLKHYDRERYNTWTQLRDRLHIPHPRNPYLDADPGTGKASQSQANADPDAETKVLPAVPTEGRARRVGKRILGGYRARADKAMDAMDRRWDERQRQQAAAEAAARAAREASEQEQQNGSDENES